jgi:GNAT superfamily N-acetyltransferase
MAAELERLRDAYNRIPEFVEQAGYDLQTHYQAVADRGFWLNEVLVGGVPIAFSTAYERGGGFYLWLLGVAPPARRHGWALQLVNGFLAEGRRRGLTVFTAKTHSGTPGMVRVLESLGFARTELGPVTMVAGGAEVTRERYLYTLKDGQ